MNRKEIIRQREIINRRFESKYFPKVKRALDGNVKKVIDAVREGGLSEGVRAASELIDSGSLNRVVSELYREVGLRYARMTWRDLQAQARELKGFGFSQVWVDFIQNFLYKFLLEKITYTVSETTRTALLNVLSKAAEEGWGVDQTVRELSGLPFTKYQAARIVRTETTRAANTGAMAAGDTFEYEQSKEWIAANDMRTRGTDPEDHASHVRLDGMVVDYEGYFVDPRNGDKLRFPGDPGGGGLPPTKPESTINCRCTVAIVAKVDEMGRLIPKTNKVVKEEPKQIEEKEVDLNPIYDRINEVKEELANQIRLLIKLNKPEVDLSPVERKSEQIKSEVERVAELVNNTDTIKELNEIKEAVKGVNNSDVNKRIDELIEKVKGIEVSPLVEVKTDEAYVIAQIQNMTASIVEALEALKKDVNKPKKWKHEVKRDHNDLIKTIISESN